jgi:tetratricopeptide (TPR) repeat protein
MPRAQQYSYAAAVSWAEQAERAKERYEGGAERDLDQRQLTQLANAAWAAGLCLLMDGRHDEARDWLRTAARRYRESWDAGAPPDSWGRPIAALKALLLAGDDARETAQWTLDVGARDAASPIGRYAGALALLVLGEDVEARALGSTLRNDQPEFPMAVADAVVTIAAADRAGYLLAVEDILESFEQRSDFLEDVRVADTVMVFQILAGERDCAVDLPQSELLP